VCCHITKNSAQKQRVSYHKKSWTGLLLGNTRCLKTGLIRHHEYEEGDFTVAAQWRIYTSLPQTVWGVYHSPLDVQLDSAGNCWVVILSLRTHLLSFPSLKHPYFRGGTTRQWMGPNKPRTRETVTSKRCPLASHGGL